MRRANSILMRSAVSAAVMCAVLRAATIGGDDRAGSLLNGNVREPGPILVRSISTIKMPVCPATRYPMISESAPALAEGRREAAVHSCANAAPVHDLSKLASLGMRARLVASFQGSTSSRASAERTLSPVPFQSSPIDAPRNWSNSGPMSGDSAAWVMSVSDPLHASPRLGRKRPPLRAPSESLAPGP